MIDEEHFDWAPNGRRYHPLTATSHAAPQPQRAPLSTEQSSAGSLASAAATYDRELSFLDLFSGPYARSDGLAAALRDAGWRKIEMIDNDGEAGGGWAHDLFNDEKYAKLLSKARARAATTRSTSASRAAPARSLVSSTPRTRTAARSRTSDGARR